MTAQLGVSAADDAPGCSELAVQVDRAVQPHDAKNVGERIHGWGWAIPGVPRKKHGRPVIPCRCEAPDTSSRASAQQRRATTPENLMTIEPPASPSNTPCDAHSLRRVEHALGLLHTH